MAAAAAGGEQEEEDDDDAATNEEQVLTLHTLEVPLQEDPGEYRTYLEQHFKGFTLLRWHLGAVDKAKGIAHAEVVVVSPPGGARG